jgi:endonuclease/exonuclease/phosphatase family metal-dependent hydrolase
MVLRYEDLLADPADGFGDVIRFLGAEPDPPRLARAIRHSAFDVLAAQERERGFVERPGAAALFFRNGRAGQWRDVLSDRQTRAVEHAQAPQMRRFAYL